MILRGTIEGDDSKLNGKPFTLDFDRDFVRIAMADREVAFSDYFPRRRGDPNDYIIVDFDNDGRVVGYAFEGLLAEWSRQSLRNRAVLFGARVRVSAQSVKLASRIVSELGKRTLSDILPRIDAQGRLPAYGY
jgi:hypothetical protein